jgi:hypothetical protein
MSSDLENFAKEAAARMGFGDEADYEEPDLEGDDELELEGEEGASDEGDEEGEPDSDELSEEEYEALSAGFWDSLTSEQRAAAEGSQQERDRLWRAYLTEPEVADEDAEADDEAGNTAATLVDAVFSGRWTPLDPDGNPIPPGVWADHIASMPEREWIALARSTGWDPNERPSYALLSQFGRGVQGAVQRASWSRTLDDLERDNEQRQREGRPPRYLGQ